MKKAKILLLEDDLTLSETVVEFLEEQGYEVVPAYNGEEASDIIYENVFDLFLLDVNVPLLNGFELLKLSVKRGFPTVMLTAYALTPEALEKSIRLADITAKDFESCF